jgi:hypothetical protein
VLRSTLFKYRSPWEEKWSIRLPLVSSSIMSQDSNPKSASRVNLDHFDPDGVQELSRTLSQSSLRQRQKSVLSDKTLGPEQSFSLERTLRAVLDRYAPSDSLVYGSCLNAIIGKMVLISREGSSVYTSGTFALPVLAPLRPTNQPLDPCSTPRLSWEAAEAHSDHPREQSFTSSTVRLDLGRCFVSIFIDHAIPGAICSRVFTPLPSRVG